MPAIEVASGNLTQSVVSSLDVWEEFRLPELYRSRGMQGSSWFMELHALGQTRKFTSKVDYHHEDNYWKPIHKVGAVTTASTGAGTVVVVQLHADVVDGTNHPAILNQIVRFANGVQAYVSAITVNGADDVDVTYKPLKAADDIGSLSASDIIPVTGNAKSEDSDQPTALTPKIQKFSHQCQIIAQTDRVSGSEMTNATWFRADSFGRNIPGMWAESLMQTEYRFFDDVSSVLMYQETGDQHTDPNNSNATVDHTEGWLPFVETNGENVAVGQTASDFDVDDFKLIIKYMKTQYGQHNYCGKLAIDRFNQFSTNMKDYFDDSNIPQVEKAMTAGLGDAYSEGLAGIVNYKYLNFSNVNFAFGEFDTFNDPQTANFTGSDLTWEAHFFPFGKMQDADSMDLVPIVGYGWKDYNGYSRRAELWEDGAAGGNTANYNGQKDRLSRYWRGEIGSDYKLGNQVYRVYTS